MTPHASTSNARGIAAMLAAMALFTANDVFVKLATGELSAGQIMALRGLVVVVTMLALVLASGQGRALRRALQPIVVLRAALESMVAMSFISALALMGIAELTALVLTAPLMITAVSAVLLRESVGWRRWSAVVAGFVGMLLIVRPTWAGIEAPALLGLLAAIGVTARDLVTRRIDPHTPSLVVGLATGIAVTLAGAALTPFGHWSMPSQIVWLWLLLAGVFVALGNLAIIMAFRHGEVSVVSPFRYGGIVFAVVAGMLVWGAIPDGIAFTGAAIIVGAGLYVAHRERVRAAESRLTTADR